MSQTDGNYCLCTSVCLCASVCLCLPVCASCVQGPTGVEFCGELCDFIMEDMPRFYSSLLPFVRVQLVEASDKVLAAFDDSLQQKALEALASKAVGSPPRRLVEVMDDF